MSNWLATVALSAQSYPSKPSDPHWTPILNRQTSWFKTLFHRVPTTLASCMQRIDVRFLPFRVIGHAPLLISRSLTLDSSSAKWLVHACPCAKFDFRRRDRRARAYTGLSGWSAICHLRRGRALTATGGSPCLRNQADSQVFTLFFGFDLGCTA